jgi:cob(I)alamin adenosyltransferase
VPRIYTKGGDAGFTSLGGGERVSKDCLRVETYGTIDELNSLLGLVVSEKVCQENAEIIQFIQNDLFAMGADIAYPQKDATTPAIPEEHIKEIENHIDTLTASLEPLTCFILPGGSPSASLLHLARTVCRRAERCLVKLSHETIIHPLHITYLNRLSDLLFTMARYQNKQDQAPEIHWRGKP